MKIIRKEFVFIAAMGVALMLSIARAGDSTGEAAITTPSPEDSSYGSPEVTQRAEPKVIVAESRANRSPAVLPGSLVIVAE